MAKAGRSYSFFIQVLLCWALSLPAHAQYGSPGEPLYDSMQAAFDALKVKDYDRAIEFLSKASKLAPTRVEIFKQIGFAEIRRGETARAIAAFERVRQLDPKDMRSLLQLGFLYDKSLRDEDAAEVFEVVSAQGDGDAAKLAKASLNLLGDKYKEEIARLRSNILNHPENMASRIRLGELLLRIRQPQAAVEHLEVGAAADALDPEGAYDLARAYEYVGKADQAQWYFYLAAISNDENISPKAKQRLKENDPEHLLSGLLAKYPAESRYRRALGFVFLQKHSNQAAQREFEQVVAAHPNDALAQLTLGYLYQSTGSRERAERAFGAAASTKSTYAAQARSALQILASGGSLPALPPTSNLLPTPPAPEGTDDLKNAAYRMRRENKIEDAIAIFRQLHELVPQDYFVIMQIGYWYWDLHALPDAKTWFELAAQAPDPAIADTARKAIQEVVKAQKKALQTSGYRNKNTGNVQAAIRDFEQIVEDDPTDFSAAMQLAYWNYDTGNVKQAAHWFRQASFSTDEEQARTARVALSNMRSAERGYWASIYVNPYYTQRFRDYLYYATFKLGTRLKIPLKIEPYVSLKLSQDTRTRGGALPQIFSDSAAVMAVGVQFHPLTPWANVFAEAGTAISLLGDLPSGRGRMTPDYRVGIAYARNWGSTLGGNAKGDGGNVFRRRSFREIWTDIEYYSRFGDNVIGYAQYKEGIRLPDAGALRTQFFVITNLVKDSNSDFYNNAAEIGPGVRISLANAPWLHFYTEYVYGAYLTKGHNVRNGGRANYDDVRVFFVYAKYF